LNEGVVSVDMQERVQSINPTMEKLLNIPHKSATGIPLSSIVDLGLQETLRTGMGKLNQIQKVGFRTIVQAGSYCRLGTDRTVTVRTDIYRQMNTTLKAKRMLQRNELSQILGISTAIQRERCCEYA
jgi:propionate catabolism operon transcriptional regulator